MNIAPNKQLIKRINENLILLDQRCKVGSNFGEKGIYQGYFYYFADDVGIDLFEFTKGPVSQQQLVYNEGR